jgi:hypothetical protein
MFLSTSLEYNRQVETVTVPHAAGISLKMDLSFLPSSIDSIHLKPDRTSKGEKYADRTNSLESRQGLGASTA